MNQHLIEYHLILIMQNKAMIVKFYVEVDMINQMVILLSQPSFLLKTVTSKHLKRKFLVQFKSS